MTQEKGWKEVGSTIPISEKIIDVDLLNDVRDVIMWRVAQEIQQKLWQEITQGPKPLQDQGEM